MTLLRWNGEHWYADDTPLWKRVVTWFVWAPYLFKRDRRDLSDRGPVSVLGHRATWHGWGFDVKVPDGWLVVVWKQDVDTGRRRPGFVERAYVSPNGTPDKAHAWLVGAPREVREAVAEYEARKARRAAERPSA